MKKYILLFFSCLQFCLFAQTVNNNGNSPNGDVIKLDPRQQQFDFVPGQILIKLKDEVNVSLGKANGAATIGVATIDGVLQKYKMKKAEKLLPNEKRNFNKKLLKTSNGKTFEQPSLHNIYKLEGDSTLNIMQVINELKEDRNVVYAEPNYILSIVDSKPVSPALNEKEMTIWLREHSEVKVSNTTNFGKEESHKLQTVTPNDPLYSQQWGIPACQIDAVWDSTTGDTTQVIAILDTGVDWLHPDLKNKIWTNPNEIPDNGIDDDHDGFIDDIRGWDYINNDNNPTDDNSHGTHVAGIAGAETNNGIGIAGVNWKAKIMPIKVFQSSGRGDAATITQGINYAATHGATVINMSFGSYARSLSMEDALANAYANCVLVAAAGNDGFAIEPCAPVWAPFFPAALSFVLGVQAPEAGFSNYDCNGPTYSNASDLLNYEMKAPGTNIISTIPNGGYRVYQGTSMSAPLISGALSLYRKLIPQDLETNEFMWVKLIQATEQYLNLKKALTIQPRPEVWFLNHIMVDTIGTDDRDGRVDAGETIQLWFSARNTGGQVDSVYWKIRLAEFEDTSTCQIIKPTSYVGSISPYATRTSENDPMVFKISPNVAHNRDITFNLLSWYKGAADTIIQNFVFTAENGEELSGVLATTKILYPNRLYLVNNSFKVGVEGTLIIKPGVKMLFYPGKSVVVNGRMIAEGTSDSMICFTGYNPPGGTGPVGPIFIFHNSSDIHNRFSYCKFENTYRTLNAQVNANNNSYNYASVFNCIFYSDGIGAVDSVVNCYSNSTSQTEVTNSYKYMKGNNFIGPSTSKDYYYHYGLINLNYQLTSGTSIFYNNFINIRVSQDPTSVGIVDSTQHNSWISEYSKWKKQEDSTIAKIILEKYNSYSYSWASPEFVIIRSQYWGTSDSAKIEGFITDFMDSPTYPRAVFQPFLGAPPDSCHAVVWKVLVNGKDAQEEIVEPIGVGLQRFDVYFNRPMDKTVIPNVSFGVRYPFSSNLVGENGSWSQDGKIWTVYKTVRLYTGDGINRVRVTGAKDLEGWEIPLEDMRFSFLISAAGSASMDFTATAGLGKVKLEWSNSKDVPDLLGYNIYRFQNVTDTTFSTPILLNSSLVSDTVYTDFNVIPNKRYYYYYRTVRTDFSESDSSRIVSTTPFTASLGDANGDLNVNVLDVLNTVSYILGQNPQPYIFDAGDVVRDSVINVLDVVGTLNIILHGTPLAKYITSAVTGNAKLELIGKNIYLSSDIPVAGLQLQFTGKGLKNNKFTINGGIPFECSSATLGDTLQKVILYSLTGKEMNLPGKYLIGTIEGNQKGTSLSEAVVSDKMGGKISVNIVDNGKTSIPDSYYIDQNYPNPFNITTTIQYGVPQKTAGRIVIYNILGQQVKTFNLGEQEPGRYKIIWNGKNNYGSTVASGVYIFRFESSKFTSAKKMLLLK